MAHPLSIRLDDDLAARLERLARLTGRSKSFYVKQALENHIEDLEDLYAAQQVAKQRVAERSWRLIPLEQVERVPRRVAEGPRPRVASVARAGSERELCPDRIESVNARCLVLRIGIGTDQRVSAMISSVRIFTVARPRSLANRLTGADAGCPSA